MAGGEGTRLQPVSSNRPKPMVRLFDKPVLEHILKLLQKNDINEACLTLRFLPHMVTDYFGDGNSLGMSIVSKIEKTPLGTAGGVRACEDFIEDEDFLVISGDAVCDFDLREAIRFHREKNAQVTILLYAHPEPLEYGLVMTAPDGRIERFIEKPGWNRVFTNLINTGIYIISPEILDEIPENESYDFGKDLFPKLLEQNKRMYGVACEGYWCDIGTCEAYLVSAMDALEGNLSVELGPLLPQGGIRAGDPLPAGVTFTPPCYIGPDTVIEKGARVGPGAVIGAGSHIGQGAAVERSVVDGARIGARAAVYGSIVCRSASVGQDSVLGEGSVIGEGTVLREGSLVAERVRIWPGKELPAGSRVTESLVGGKLRSGLKFVGSGVIAGVSAVDITPEACFAIGAAIESGSRAGVGFSGENAARLAALSVECGICSAGGNVMELDGGFEAAASFATDLYGLDHGIFVRQKDGRIELSFFGKNGDRITRERERKIESAISRGDSSRADPSKAGSIRPVSGTLDAYISSAAGWGELGAGAALTVSVTGAGAPNRALRKTLELMGCDIVSRPRSGIPGLDAYRGGFLLRAVDEEGRDLDSERLLTILTMIEFENGSGKVAVPYKSPFTLDLLAKNYGTKVLRLGKDSGAEELYYRQPYLRDGVFAAARLVGAMALRGESLKELGERAPEFSTARREISVYGDKAAVMRELSASCAEFSSELFEGLSVDTGKGRVRVTPSATRPVLKISGESDKMEAAEELCFEFECRARDIDSYLTGD